MHCVSLESKTKIMAITLSAPRFSFVQFSESSVVTSCNFADISLCLPVYEHTDVAFQFIAVAGTEEEADGLCDLVNDTVKIGIVKSCADELLIEFTEKPQRFRISPLQVLYNWSEGLPDFDTVIEIGECFMVKIILDETYSFCSNCFQRIADPCHTSVVEYGNDENGFGFNYCNSAEEDIDSAEDCEPTIIAIYTASLQAKYGNMPSVQVWIYDENSELVNMGIRVAFDAYPPTELRLDFGGPASGVLKIL
jgi:hypothetical protein